MIDPKHPIPGQNAGNAQSGPGDGAHQILGSQGSPNIGEDELLVNKTAAQQGNEDIKNIMEHVKNISGDDGLDDLHMQDLIQKNQKSLDELSNISKKTSDTSDSIITKGGGVGPPGGGKKKAGLAILGVLLLLGLGGFFAIRAGNPGPPDQNPGPPEANPGPPEQPVQYPPDPGLVCPLHFVSPANAEAIPLEGALDVAWSGLPEAFSYEFDVIPPTGAGNPWVIRTEGTSRTIYMENFPAAGQYRFGLSALDAKGAVLCVTELTFDKGALDEKTRTGGAADGAGKAPCTSMLACP